MKTNKKFQNNFIIFCRFSPYQISYIFVKLINLESTPLCPQQHYLLKLSLTFSTTCPILSRNLSSRFLPSTTNCFIKSYVLFNISQSLEFSLQLRYTLEQYSILCYRHFAFVLFTFF